MEVTASPNKQSSKESRIAEAIHEVCEPNSHLTEAMVERFGEARDIPELREALRSLEQEIHEAYAAALESFSSK
ncbi:hypothetical protein ACFSJ3_18125 [Corallincola platygyrae]|uniref:Uncharacterized protein n=1 Tax=Corallincola platygyrae TaxID=1193278 RepID=A0ABW4XVG9_9GAMM